MNCFFSLPISTLSFWYCQLNYFQTIIKYKYGIQIQFINTNSNTNIVDILIVYFLIDLVKTPSCLFLAHHIVSLHSSFSSHIFCPKIHCKIPLLSAIFSPNCVISLQFKLLYPSPYRQTSSPSSWTLLEVFCKAWLSKGLQHYTNLQHKFLHMGSTPPLHNV